MLKRLTVKNFKCLRNIDVPLGPFNVLIGPNDTGKTSFLDALQLLSMMSTFPTVVLENYFQEPWSLEKLRWLGSSEPEIQFGLQYDNLDYSIEVTTRGGKTVVKCESLRNSEAVLLQGKEANSQHEYKVEYKGQVISTTRQCSALSSYRHTPEDELTRIATLLQNVKCYTLKPSQLSRDSYLEPDRLQEPQMDASGYGLPSILSILASTAPEDPRYQEIKKYLREAIPQVTNFGIAPVPVRWPVVSREDQSTKNDADLDLSPMKSRWENIVETTQYLDVTGQSLYFELKGHKNRKIPASLMSDGVLLILGYLTLVYTTKHPAILLIEEPENGIHPKLLRFVTELLRGLSRGLDETTPPVQIIMTTHSPYLLDWTAPEEAYIFQKDQEGASTITPMAKIEGIKELLSDSMLGELWTNWGEEELVRRAKL